MGILNTFILLLLAVTLLAPLIYAVGTLRGLRHKRLYPIVRFGDDSQCLRPRSSDEDVVVEG